LFDLQCKNLFLNLVCDVHPSSFDFDLVAVSALHASVLLPKDFLIPSKIFSFLLVSWFSPLKSVFIDFLWPVAGSVLLLSGGQALLASRPVACFSSQVFHSFSCRSGLSSADLELIARCSFSLSNAKDWFCRQCFLWLPRQLAAQIWSMSSVKR
jgi:hypothetical protein